MKKITADLKKFAAFFYFYDKFLNGLKAIIQNIIHAAAPPEKESSERYITLFPKEINRKKSKEKRA